MRRREGRGKRKGVEGLVLAEPTFIREHVLSNESKRSFGFWFFVGFFFSGGYEVVLSGGLGETRAIGGGSVCMNVAAAE